ncbi:protein-tyrosine kinase 6b [Brachyhypopomus gauderio]|uniref:protein-tyrosine kinase 6b n=1 Tax=Brachyhypopomus gauderio TaxID=698409 RepID=UPI0040435BC0
MGECLRRTCPCLRTCWDRIFKNSTPDEFGGKGDTGRTVDGVNNKLENNMSDPRYGPASVHEPVDNAVFTALWAFEARADEELSFEAGDMFKMVSCSGDWWTAHKLDSCGCVLATGIVPYNYLERGESVASQPWFFGKMNRFESLSHLMSADNGDGAFLVRLSENDNVGHVLSVRVKNGVKHFKVYQMDSGFYVDQSRCFPSLLELIEYYQNHRLGAVHRLGMPCIRRQPQPQDLSHTTVDKWELPKEDFTLGEKLGSGQFADVYRGKWKKRINVAIKILKNNESLNQQDFQMEVQLLKRLRHRHLISLFAICTSSAPYYIITELMEKGNLLDFLRSTEGGALDLVSLIDMAAQVAAGMVYLEDHNSIHRDLAARNVLVGEGYICKVADFGLARFIKEAVYISEEKKIPYKWTAPEAIIRGRYSNKSDVWSFGILLYEIITYGGVPYPGFTTNEAIKQVMHRGYRMPAPPKCPRFLYDVMLSCWRDSPEDRPDFKQLTCDLENINRYTELE